MKPLQVATLMAGLMALASAAGVAIRPPEPTPAAAGAPRYVLETAVPRSFSGWREIPTIGAVENPQTAEMLSKLYSQVLTRTYVNGDGYRIMLSLAYGGDQRGSMQAHKPEICYPAQGFTLHSNVQGEIVTPFGRIETRQLRTSLGPRQEPVTYWFAMGSTVATSKLQQRLIELRFTITGQVPDGLMFRISSIDADPARAFTQHQGFANDLLSAVSPADRTRLSGLTAQAPL